MWFARAEMFYRSTSEISSIVSPLPSSSYAIYSFTGCHCCKGCPYCTASEPKPCTGFDEKWIISSPGTFLTIEDAQAYCDGVEQTIKMDVCEAFTFYQDGSTELMNCLSKEIKGILS